METNAPKLLISLWVLVSVSLMFVAFRFLFKRRYHKRYCCDDYLLAVAWVSVTIYAAIITVSTTHGLGKHLVDIEPTDLVLALKAMYIGQTFAGIALATSKVSFAVTLLRLVQRRWQKWFLWFAIVSTSLAFALVVIFGFVACTPVQRLWDIRVKGTCWGARSLIGYSIFVGSYSAFIDVLLAIFPSMIIWNIQMSRAEKAGVTICMSLGFLAGIVAALKTSSITSIAIWRDFTYSGVKLLIWATAEITMTITAVCIPCFRLAVHKSSERSSRHESRGYAIDEFTEQTGSPRTGTTTRPDDGSEEFILTQTEDGKIVQLSLKGSQASCNDGREERQKGVHDMV